MPLYGYQCPKCRKNCELLIPLERKNDEIFCWDIKCGTLMRRFPRVTMIEYQDPAGVTIFEEPMRFSCLFSPGDRLCAAGRWYRVEKVEVTSEIQCVRVVPEESPL